MSQRLRNRRAVEAKLGAFVDNIIVTEELVTSILDGEARFLLQQNALSLAARCLGCMRPLGWRCAPMCLLSVGDQPL